MPFAMQYMPKLNSIDNFISSINQLFLCMLDSLANYLNGYRTSILALKCSIIMKIMIQQKKITNYLRRE